MDQSSIFRGIIFIKYKLKYNENYKVDDWRLVYVSVNWGITESANPCY